MVTLYINVYMQLKMLCAHTCSVTFRQLSLKMSVMKKQAWMITQTKRPSVRPDQWQNHIFVQHIKMSFFTFLEQTFINVKCKFLKFV